MTDGEKLLVAAVVVVGVVVVAKKAQAAGVLPGGETQPLPGLPGVNAWSPAKAAEVKTALGKLTALPDVPTGAGTNIQQFTLTPNALGLGAADLMARTFLLAQPGAAVWTNKSLTRMMFTGDGDISGLQGASDWFLLATGSVGW